MKARSLAPIGIALVLLSASPSRILSVPQSFTEDFTTTTYRDPLNTTAEWDTTAGELRLPSFECLLEGSVATAGDARAVAVSGNHAFVAADAAGLLVVDITDPSNPVPAGSYDTAGYVFDVAVVGDLAFLADYSSPAGLTVVDIRDPTNPVLAGSYNTPGDALGVTIAGTVAFVADGYLGLTAIDIADPASPALLGTCATTDNAYAVAVDGDLAFVAQNYAGLGVIDISDPANPVLVGTCDTPDRALSVCVSGDFAFVADGASGLQVIDIIDPANPVILGTYDTPEYACDVVVSGDLALVADQHGGLRVLDVTDPAHPALAGNYDSPGIARGVAVAGTIAFLADATGGLEAVRIGLAASPAVIGSYLLTPPRKAKGVVTAGDLAFVAVSSQGLLVLDISDPAVPMLVGACDTLPGARRVEIAGDFAYVANSNRGFSVVDISDPANPVVVGTWDTSAYTHHVVVSGDLAVVANDYAGVCVVDVSDPASPVLAGTCDTPTSAEALTIAGDFAFVAVWNSGLYVISISDPALPVIAGTCALPGWSYEVVLSGNVALVAGTQGLHVVDVSDPTNPVHVVTYGTPGQSWGVDAAGDRAFVAATGDGLQVIDISDPTHPVLLGACDTPDMAEHVFVAGELAFVADQLGGLQVIRIGQHEAATDTAVGRSLPVDGAGAPIVCARVQGLQSGNVSWRLSVDAGANWMDVSADATWTRGPVPGTGLLWQTTHAWAPGPSATVYGLTVDWRNEFGPITSVTDVPDDQGGWVRVAFTRSGFDFAAEDSLPVTGYQVYQRVDDGALRERILGEGVVPTETERDAPAPHFLGPGPVRLLGSRRFVIGDDRIARGSFPPGVWEAVAWVAATQSDAYQARVSTTGDSTQAGTDWSVFLVTTHTTTPSVWFACPPDSGYSIDNISPGIPQNLAFAGPGVLEWDAASEGDFAYHSVYGSASEVLDGTATLVGRTVEPGYDVSADPHAYYHVTTSDHAGNESDAATATNPAVGAPGPPAAVTALALHAPRPNPFRAGTSIVFDLPEPGDVQLGIFDAAGRQIRVLVKARRPAGRHRVTWNGTNEDGLRVASGIYFARMRAGGVEVSRRLVAIR